MLRRDCCVLIRKILMVWRLVWGCLVRLPRRPSQSKRAKRRFEQKMLGMYSFMAIFTGFGVLPALRNIHAVMNTLPSSKKVPLLTVRNVYLDVRHCVTNHLQRLTCFIYSAEARLARSARPIRVGTLRPAIVLYDETHPLGDDIGDIHTADLSRTPDMLIIMGTSLKVHGLKKLVKDFARVVHSASSSRPSSSKKPFKVLFVNKTVPAAEWSDIIDYHISGETDRWSNRVIDDWKKMRPADWEIQQKLVAGDGESTATGRFKSVKSTKPSNTSKPRHPLTERENVGPTSSKPPQKSAVNEAKLAPPLSPSKRQKKTSHYDDLESSPSKRRTTSKHDHAMPASERRMLFIEKTNQPAASAINDMDKSKMDMSLCELSMRDVKSGDMDVSILELSMIDVEAMVEEQPLIKSRTKVRSKLPDTKRKPTARMVTRPKRVNTRTDAVS